MPSAAPVFAPFGLERNDGEIVLTPRRDEVIPRLVEPRSISYANTENLRSTAPFVYVEYDASELVIDFDNIDMEPLSSDEDEPPKEKGKAMRFLRKIMTVLKAVRRKVFANGNIRLPFTTPGR
ncbi:hypothetical protein BDZ97DRAFT_1916124 [Flammula alnicola]|nr:hypothetical protein BDZ97DRAFT_1916124 [Flammula alnicola]